MSAASNINERDSRIAARQRLLAASCLALATLAFLTPAIINGYPFIFPDTGTYLLSAVRLYVPYDRPVFYSIFAALLHLHVSPWPIAIAQSALIAILVRLTATAVFSIASPWVMPIAAVVLTVGSSLPWFSGQIVPDIFTPVLMLALLLTLFGWERMTATQRWFVLCLIPVCVAVHNANFLVALCAIPAIAMLLLTGWRSGPEAARRIFLVMSGVAVALAAIGASNYAARGKLVLSPASSTLLFAKMLEDGPALEELERDCPAAYPLLCSQLAELERHKASGMQPSLGDFFLWEGPLDSLGWWKPVEPEASQVVKKALAHFWLKEARTALANGVRQFWHFKSGDGLEPDPGAAATGALRDVFGESGVAAYRRSLQGRDELPLSKLSALHLVIFAASCGILLWSAIASVWADWKALHLNAFVAVMLFGHAMAIGALTPLHDRYQSRVVWLVPLLAALTLWRRVIKAIRGEKWVFHFAPTAPLETPAEGT